MDCTQDNLRIENSGDGSPTLYSSAFNAHYHSIHGAIQESEHVFIEEGLNRLQKKEIKVLEIGLGTGLNALLTLRESIDRKLIIHYTGIELYPISESLAEQLNYAELVARPELKASFLRINQCPWEKPEIIAKDFVLTKVRSDILDCEFGQGIDLVYFDAFGPGTQEELWNEKLFKRIFTSMKQGGVLSTYCAKGSVRRMMISVGFSVEKVPGPPGKREMLVAIK